MPDLTTSDGVSIHYEEYGAGSPLVLVHGWSGSHRYFQLNTPVLAKTFRVIVFDQRFHGESGKPLHGFHVARLAADLYELLSALQLKHCTLLGSSMVRVWQWQDAALASLVL